MKNENYSISEKIHDIIQDMRAFRNVLVYLYNKLDDLPAFDNI